MNTRPRFIVGMDLGQTHDPTAVVVVEVIGRDKEARFDVRHLERILGKPYTFVADRVKALTQRLAEGNDVAVAFDQTGVGRAVADILRSADLGVPLHGITITAGDVVTTEGNEHRVPKKDLVAGIQVILQGRRLRIAKALPLAELLTRELLNFKVKVTGAGNEAFETWRAGDHDDFVLALAVAVWLGSCRPPGSGWLDYFAMMSEDRLREESFGRDRWRGY